MTETPGATEPGSAETPPTDRPEAPGRADDDRPAHERRDPYQPL